MLEGAFELTDLLINGGDAELNVGYSMTIIYVFECGFSISDPYNSDEGIVYPEYFNASAGADHLNGGDYNPATGLWGFIHMNNV